MARKLNKNLLALGSAAIVSIYAVGFVRTAATSANPSVAGAGPAAVTATTQAQPTSATAAIAQAIASATPSSAGSATAPNTTQTASAKYKDGTYNGTGTSRLGDVSVAVTIQGGQITAVQITGGTTHYPLSRISQLPGEVVSAQGASIKLVSGATYSSQAFKDAVTQALSQAATSA